MKIIAPAIITSREVIIAGYDAILDQSDQQNLYNHLSNYTKGKIVFGFVPKYFSQCLKLGRVYKYALRLSPTEIILVSKQMLTENKKNNVWF